MNDLYEANHDLEAFIWWYKKKQQWKRRKV